MMDKENILEYLDSRGIKFQMEEFDGGFEYDVDSVMVVVSQYGFDYKVKVLSDYESITMLTSESSISNILKDFKKKVYRFNDTEVDRLLREDILIEPDFSYCVGNYKMDFSLLDFDKEVGRLDVIHIRVNQGYFRVLGQDLDNYPILVKLLKREENFVLKSELQKLLLPAVEQFKLNKSISPTHKSQVNKL